MHHVSPNSLTTAQAPACNKPEETLRAEQWIAGARECGLVVFPWRGRKNDSGGVMQFGQEDDGPNDFGAASHRFLSHPARNVMDGCRQGVVFETLCAELGIDPDDVDLCAKVNSHLAQQAAARPPAMQAAE